MFKDLLVNGTSHVVHHRETADGFKKMIIRPGNGGKEQFDNANPLTAAGFKVLKGLALANNLIKIYSQGKSL